MAKKFKSGVSVNKSTGKISISSSAKVGASTRAAVSKYNSSKGSSVSDKLKSSGMTPPEVSTPAIQKSSDLNAGIKKAGKVLTIDQSVRAVPLTAAQIKSLEKGGYTVNIKNSGSSSSSPDAVSAPTEDKNTSSAIKKLEDKGILKSGKNIQINTDVYGQVPTATIKALEKQGLTVSIVTSADIAAKTTPIKTEDEKKKADDLTASEDKKTSLNDTWETVGKSSDAEKVSEFLNSQEGNKFDVRVEGDKIVGTKNGVKTEWKYDGENWSVDTTSSPGNQMDEDKSAMENMQDNTEILPIVENSLENIKQAMDEQTAVVVDANDEKNREMNAIYESQDKAIRSKYADMWKTIQESEMQGKSSLEEIDALNRKQYQDNVESVARKASGRKSSLAGQMSAQGFDASVIANMAGQIDSQYADERLAVQNQHIGNLQKTYESYKALYDDLLANKQNLTNNERTFMESVAARMKALKDTEVEMAKMESQSYQPLIDFNKQLLAAYSTAQTSDATAAGYESSWKVGDTAKRISNLSSQLHSFIGSELKADGTPKYDTNAIPADKMAEFAKASTAREAYQMAVAYLTNGANNSADLYADAAAASGSSSGGSSSSSSSSSTPSANKETPAEKGNTEVNIDAALNDAKLLEQNGGFKKTDITYDQYVTALKSAKTPEALKVLQNKIAPALAATPQVSKSNELEIQKKAALAPYTSLSADQLAVLKASPWWSQISGLVEKVQGYKSTESKYAAVNLFTASDKTKLANAKNSLDIAIKKILAGKTNLAI